METTFSVEAIVKTGNMNAKLILLANKSSNLRFKENKTTNSISLKKARKKQNLLHSTIKRERDKLNMISARKKSPNRK